MVVCLWKDDKETSTHTTSQMHLSARQILRQLKKEDIKWQNRNLPRLPSPPRQSQSKQIFRKVSSSSSKLPLRNDSRPLTTDQQWPIHIPMIEKMGLEGKGQRWCPLFKMRHLATTTAMIQSLLRYVPDREGDARRKKKNEPNGNGKKFGVSWRWGYRRMRTPGRRLLIIQILF